MRISSIAVCALIAIFGVGLQNRGWTEGSGTMMEKSDQVANATEAQPLVSNLDEETEAMLQDWIEGLKTPNARRVKRKIVTLGEEAVPDLVAALDEEETTQAQQIIEILGNIGDKRAMPRLIVSMNSDISWIRCASVYAIGKIGGKDAVPILMNALRDENFRVCEISIETLASFDDLRVVPILIDLLQSPQHDIVEKSANALAKLSGGSPNYGSDWMSWQLWYDTDSRFDQYRDISQPTSLIE